MKVSRNWLQDYIEDALPTTEELVEAFTMHAFEVDGTEKVGDDDVIEVKILPDRAHYALSHYGVAEEIAVILGLKLKPKNKIKLPDISKELEVGIEDPKLCRRYCGAVIKGVKVGQSPEWLRQKLEAIGQRSINNIVDATNYVMFSIGQPTHVFDLGKIKKENGNAKIAVRKLAAPEKIKALDSKEYELKEGTLVIADGNSGKTLAIAGVKGGAEALVDEKTTDILLESANFDPVIVRKTGRALGLVTDAQKRFENELTPELALQGLSDLVALITEIAGGTVEGCVDMYPKPVPAYKVGASLREINETLGTRLNENEVEEILQKLGWKHKEVMPHDLVVKLATEALGKPYKWGASVLYEAPDSFDCSSLTSYLYKEAGVAIPRVVADQYMWGEKIAQEEVRPGDLVFSKTQRRDNKIHTETVDFMKGTPVPDEVSHVGVFIGDNRIIHAADPEGVIEEDIAASVRFKEITGYRRMAKLQEKRWVVTIPAERLDLRIKEDLVEEIGRIYGYEHIEAKAPAVSIATELNENYALAETIRAKLAADGYSEVYTYAFRDKGEVQLENPLASDKAFLRNNLKDGVKESLDMNVKNKELLGLDAIKIFEIGNVFTKDAEETRVCIATQKEIKEMTLEEAKKYLNIEDVSALPHYEISNAIFKPISIYPFITRDIAVWIPQAENKEKIIGIIKKEGSELLVREPRQFDEFTKEGRTSHAFRMVFQSMDRTLTDDEVNAIMHKITDTMNAQDGWQVR